MSCRLLLFFLIACNFFSCAPPRYVPKPKDFQQSVNGLMIKVFSVDEKIYYGECLVVDADSLFLLDYSPQLPKKESKTASTSPAYILLSNNYSPSENRAILIFHKNDIEKVDFYPARVINGSGLTLGYALMVPLSIGHGWYGGVSGLINLAFAIGQGIDNSKPYFFQYPQDLEWSKLSRFARFPAGFPITISREEVW